MSELDRQHWDSRWIEAGKAPIIGVPPPPPVFADIEGLFPSEEFALEIACGRGRGAVWLAKRGMTVLAVDVSLVAVGLAGELAKHSGVASRCQFKAHDLDQGLPNTEQADLLFCHLYRDPQLDQPIIKRLAPGGLLAMACLSEVGAGAGEFRIPAGSLRQAFGSLEVLDENEGEGMARILVRKPV